MRLEFGAYDVGTVFAKIEQSVIDRHMTHDYAVNMIAAGFAANCLSADLTECLDIGSIVRRL